LHQNRLANRIEGLRDDEMAAETACEADGREQELGGPVQNRECLIQVTAGESLSPGDIVKLGDDGRATKRKMSLEVRQFYPILIATERVSEGDRVYISLHQEGMPCRTE
jgi:hypothetical protein